MRKLSLSIVSILGGAAVAATVVKKVTGNATEAQRNMSEKHLELFLMMNRWVEVKQQGKNLADYLEKMEYKTIAIYGMSYAGERLLDELRGSNIQVKYGIDRRADTIYSDIDVVTMEDELEPVDAIIVTPVFFFDEIETELTERVDCPIISLKEILHEV